MLYGLVVTAEENFSPPSPLELKPLGAVRFAFQKTALTAIYVVDSPLNKDEFDDAVGEHFRFSEMANADIFLPDSDHLIDCRPPWEQVG